MKKIQRKDFIKGASITAVAASTGLLAACNTKKENKTVSINTNETYDWKMVTAWPPGFPILGEYAEKVAKWIAEASDGRMRIQVYGGGELVPALEVFDAVSGGVAEMGHSAPYYWAGKLPAAQIFSSVPFGMTARQMYAWHFFGGGLEMWRELYADFNLYPFPCGNTGGQMGGWFNKEINSIGDFKGLKMRIPGLGGKVITKTGASSILSPGGELYTNLERGVIDALEWIGPYHDYLMGFHKIAKYYYYPGWHEPASMMELMVNREAFEKLPNDLKNIITVASGAVNTLMLSAFDQKNMEYYLKMKKEGRVEFREFSEPVLNKLKAYTDEVMEEITGKDSMSKKAYESFNSFKMNMYDWFKISERNYR